ncbi:hypothetical protein [Novosphingobium sp. FSW06-99]|uniref:hypothetical protein n=1 Tax=Novosphingobium sp. FSW06-99 TaxID=1739113 RepID=UPI000A65E297|nr:hypothetical protein [Novosphingobium sp. FSW06-99]
MHLEPNHTSAASDAVTYRLAGTVGAACLALLPVELRDTLPLLVRSGPAFGLRLLTGR